MLLRPLFALAMACASMAFVPASAGPSKADAVPPPDGQDARAWLMRIHEAAKRRSFQGTFIVSGGGLVSSSHIAHYCDGSSQYESIESLDGQARRVFRHNDLVQTVWPGTRVALVEQSQLLMSFPALLQAGNDRIVDYYELRRDGQERVAGHEADVLVLQPKDALRYGYRLWAEKTSGLLLRADVLGEKNETLETSAFSEVTIGVRPQPEHVMMPMRHLDGYRVVRPVLTATRLEDEGWVLNPVVPGFRQVSCVRRAMDDGAQARSDDSAPTVLQTILSDGLTHVSVFIEPYSAQRHTRPMLASVGATQTLMGRKGDWWVTIVGDVPPATLRRFANALERQKK